MKVVICEKCYNIPKITILNNSKARIECEKCKETRIENKDYFNKFINDKDNDNYKLFALDKCNYDDHDEKKESIVYCFQCDKYICKDCLENLHNKSHLGRHSTIKQKLLNDYYCKKFGHEEYILDHYCEKCKKYLCSKCKCTHDNLFNFENKEETVNKIKNKLKRCVEIIKIGENNLKEFIKIIQEKIAKLTNLFNDYKNRNLNAISLYELLINNYEQSFNKIRNYNIYNNIDINNNFNLNESKICTTECLISAYNTLSAFYMNTNHIKTETNSNYYISSKKCNNNIKKCLFISDNIISYIFKERLKNINFVYKLKNNSPYKEKKVFFDDYIIDIYPLDKNKFAYLNDSKNIKIVNINLKENDLEFSINEEINEIDYCFMDFYFDNRFFFVQNKDNSFNILYADYDNNNSINLISKENKKYKVEYIIDDIREKIDDSNINEQEKTKLKDIFIYNGEDDEKLGKLIDINKTILKFLDDKNKDSYNKLRNKINENEDKYMFNSNYIYKAFKRIIDNLDNYNLNEEEKEEIKYNINLQNLCGDLLQLFTGFIIFNSKINNIYNYKNNFLFFMGKNYSINIYSLKEKKFKILEPINIFINVVDYNNFEIIQMTSDKVIFNDSKNKTIYFLENNNNDFCLLKKTIKYYYNIAIDNNYLLYDKITNDNLEFSIIDLSNLDKKNSDLLELLNIKINFNIPKIISTKEFKKIISIYDDNQICIMEYSYNAENINENNIIIDKINLIKDNNSENTPSKNLYHSTYSDSYTPKNLFIQNNYYYCSKSNKNDEYLMFDFENEYWFNKVVITYIDKYQDDRIKSCNIIIYDQKKRIIKNIQLRDLKMDLKSFPVDLNYKFRFIKFELLENHGGNYFIIKNIEFSSDETYSIK